MRGRLGAIADGVTREVLSDLLRRMERMEATQAMERPRPGTVVEVQILTPDQDPLDALLPDRVAKVLRQAGYGTVQAVIEATDEELRAVSGIGPNTLHEIRQILARED